MTAGELSRAEQTLFEQLEGLGAFVGFEKFVVGEGDAHCLAKDQHVWQQRVFGDRFELLVEILELGLDCGPYGWIECDAWRRQ